MPESRWPYRPESFISILPRELPSFLQTGATHTIGRAVSLIDPQASTRIDALERFDRYEGFCKCLRGGCERWTSHENFDVSCRKFDLLVAKKLLADSCGPVDEPTRPRRYRCYTGLEELATLVWVGGVPVMVVSGQYRPPDGLEDLITSVCCLGDRRPLQSEVSAAMWQDMSRLGVPDELWLQACPSEEDRELLLSYAEQLRELSSEDEDRLLGEAKRIQRIAEHYHRMQRISVEAEVVSELTEAELQLPSHAEAERSFWAQIGHVLDELRTSLSVAYVACYVGERDDSTLLTLRAYSSGMPIPPERGVYPHFNWRKAGLKTHDSRDSSSQVLDAASVTVEHRSSLLGGFRGGASVFLWCTALVPVEHPGGPLALIVIGEHEEGADLANEESFVFQLGRRIGGRILSLRVNRILTDERVDWERTSRLTGHRVRAACQSLGSQLRVIRDATLGRPGFTEADRVEAEADLDRAAHDLIEISWAAESSYSLVDARVAGRELVPLGNIISDGVSNQEELASEHEVKIEVHPEISRLPQVYANVTLMRFAFINLVNNGLKYSYPRPDFKERILRIGPPLERDELGRVSVEVENFGLGILPEDTERVFEWGVRLAPGEPTFREVYGKGVGLWETKRIIEAHGGHVYVRSSHHSGGPVTEWNKKQCITVFTVELPRG